MRVALFALLLSSWSAHAADTPALLDQQAPAILAANGVAGVSIAQVVDGKLAFAVAYGQQAPGVPATPGSLYNIASLSKPISAEVVLRLVASGAVSLDEPMVKHWLDPDLASEARRDLLTPRIALSHQTGFANWRRMSGNKLSMAFTPGTAYAYSGEGYGYVAHFAENKTGKAFEAMAQALLFDPLGMRDTAYTGRPWFAGRIALPSDKAGKFLAPEITNKYIAADLVYSTPTDFAKFAIAVMNGEGLDPATARERIRLQVSRKADMCGGAKAASCPDEAGFGLGWELMQFGSTSYLMHTGNDEGVFTFAYINLANKSATIMFFNSANAPKAIMPLLDLMPYNPQFRRFLHGQIGD